MTFDLKLRRLLTILILTALQTAYAGDAARQLWEQKLPLLTNGMTRAQVEGIFPVYTNEMPRSVAGGGSYNLAYALDANTEIALCYSEVEISASGIQALVGQNQSNRLIKVLGLYDRTMRGEENK